MKRCLLLVAPLLLAGCIVRPRTVSDYDQECRIVARHMELRADTFHGDFFSCSNQQCAPLLIAAGVVSVGSAVVSGSIFVAGNVVYWFEKKERCMAAPRQRAEESPAEPLH